MLYTSAIILFTQCGVYITLIKNIQFNVSYYLIDIFRYQYVNDSMLILTYLSSNILTILVITVLLGVWFIKLSLFTQRVRCIVLLFILYSFVGISVDNNFVSILCNFNQLNTNLQNGLLNIHPPIIYYVYSMAVVVWIVRYFSKKPYLLFNTTTQVYTILFITIVGVLLGAVWAVQELNWGGFWSWDPVEIISIFILLIFISVYHKSEQTFFKTTMFIYILLYSALIYGIIRLNIVNTIHAFITTMNLSLYKYALLLAFTLLLLYIIKYNSPKVRNSIRALHLKIIPLMIKFIGIYVNILIIYFYIILLNATNYTVLYNDISTLFSILLFFILYWYTLFKYNFTPSEYFYISILLGVIIVLFYQINQVMLLVCIFFLCYVYTHKFKDIHNTIVITYIIFFFFYLNTPVYSPQVQYNIVCTYNTTYLFDNLNLNQFYEGCSYVQKQSLVWLYKSMYTHINTFTMITNMFSFIFIYIKNSWIYSYFYEDFIAYIFCMYLIIISINIYNQAQNTFFIN